MGSVAPQLSYYSPLRHQERRAGQRFTSSEVDIRRLHARQRKYSAAHQIFFRSLILLALVFILIQAGRAVITNTVKLTGLIQHSVQLDKIHLKTNQNLKTTKQRIQFYSSAQGIEELARNELDMVGPNEVLVELIR